jgi:hypothetical protein
MQPVSFGDDLSDSVEEDLFAMATDEFEEKYKIRSDASDLVPSISAYDLPIISDSVVKAMTDAAARVGPEDFQRAHRSAQGYLSGVYRIPTRELQHVSGVLAKMATLRTQGAINDASSSELIHELGRASSELREKLSALREPEGAEVIEMESD